MSAGRDDGPGVRIPPPVMVAALIGLAWGAMQWVPLRVVPPMPAAALAVVALGVAVAIWAVVVMVFAGTDPRPDKPDAAMVESGPFRFSRNPVYLGFVVVAAGLALRWGDAWGWLAVAASFLVLDRLVVAKEERYLAARFGEAYADYCRRVRRWV